MSAVKGQLLDICTIRESSIMTDYCTKYTHLSFTLYVIKKPLSQCFILICVIDLLDYFSTFRVGKKFESLLHETVVNCYIAEFRPTFG